MYELLLIPDSHRESLFPTAWHFLKDGYLDGMSIATQEQLYDRIQNGTSQLWLLSKDKEVVGAAVTELWDLKDGNVRILHAPLAGGDIVDGMETILRAFEKFAGLNDAVEVQMTVRPAIAKLSKAFGYKTKALTMKRTINNTEV